MEVPKVNSIVPPLIQDLIEAKHISKMDPGESTYVVPWAVKVNEDYEVSLSPEMGERRHQAGGTSELKVVKDFNGIYLDATRLSLDAIESYFGQKQHAIAGVDPEAEGVPVKGVLYPIVVVADGMEPGALESYNTEQRKVHEDFARYYNSTYGVAYVFAALERTMASEFRQRRSGVQTKVVSATIHADHPSEEEHARKLVEAIEDGETPQPLKQPRKRRFFK